MKNDIKKYKNMLVVDHLLAFAYSIDNTFRVELICKTKS